jgi:hypothetical protein
MWFPQASKLVRLLITLVEETAQALAKAREEAHGNIVETAAEAASRRAVPPCLRLVASNYG